MRNCKIAFRRFLFAILSVAAWLGADPTRLLAQTVSNNATNAVRPPHWAVKLERPNLKNFYQVATNLYRGAQPDARGMAELKAMGIKTVVNLRSFHSDKDETRGLGLTLQRLHLQPWHSEEEDVVSFLRIAAGTNNYPIFVHCQRGADRTGLVCAMYRVVFCGWTKPEAIREMREGGFDFDPRWKNIVKFIERADIEELKRKAGIAVEDRTLNR